MFEENTTSEIREIEGSYKISREKEEFLKNKYIADYWTATFFWQHKDKENIYPDPADVLEVGQTVEARVIEINRNEKRIGLTLKPVGESSAEKKEAAAEGDESEQVA